MDSITLGRQPSTRWYRSAISCYIWDTRKHSNPERWVLSHSGPIESKGSMANTGLQWGSMASMRLKGVQRGSKASRGSKRFKDPGGAGEIWCEESRVEAWRISESSMVLQKCHTEFKKTNKWRRSELGCCRDATSFFLWHYSVCHCGTARHNI